MEYTDQQKVALFHSAGPSKVHEFILMKASIDETFFRRILMERNTVLQELGLAASPELMDMLNAAPIEQFEMVVKGTVVPEELSDVLMNANDLESMERAKIAIADVMIAKGEVVNIGPALQVPQPDPMPVTGSRPGGPFRGPGPGKSGGLFGWLKRLFGGK